MDAVNVSITSTIITWPKFELDSCQEAGLRESKGRESGNLLGCLESPWHLSALVRLAGRCLPVCQPDPQDLEDLSRPGNRMIQTTTLENSRAWRLLFAIIKKSAFRRTGNIWSAELPRRKPNSFKSFLSSLLNAVTCFLSVSNLTFDPEW